MSLKNSPFKYDDNNIDLFLKYNKDSFLNTNDGKSLYFDIAYSKYISYYMLSSVQSKQIYELIRTSILKYISKINLVI